MPSLSSRATRTFAVNALFLLFPCVSRATIRYSVSLAEREQNLLHVRMEVPAVDRELIVAMPVWNALYQVRDFAHRIERLRAVNAAGEALPIAKSDPQTWHVAASGVVSLEYSILWDDFAPFGSDVSAAHAFLNFAEVLLYVPSRRAEDVRLEFTSVPRAWRVAVALDAAGPPAEPGVSFTAPSYDALADAPAEIGGFDEFSLEAGAAHVEVVVHASAPGPGGRPSWSSERLADELRRVVITETTFMRDVPFSRYLFIFHFGFGGGGGMEHANSTAIALDAGADAASIAAHEFFHLWNVKRIRPQSLEPVDYTRAQPSAALWFAEGVTSTVGAYTMLRSGLWTRPMFYADLASELEMLESRPAHEWQSAEESSLNAWLEKYPLYRRGTFSISYYNKGKILGLLLDIFLRRKTNNRAGLDDLLRDLNERYARHNRPYEDSVGIRDAAKRLAGPAAARDVDDFFRRYVSGTDELPLDDYLRAAGLELRVSERVIADAGFQPAASPFGTGRSDANAIVPVVRVAPGGLADQAGLRRGDRIIEVNRRPTPPDLAEWLESLSPGVTLRLRILRGNEEKEISLTLGRRAVKSYTVQEDPRAGKDSLACRIREGLLTGSTNP
jgi:predicted metalloprotease with PDZ domain